MRLSLSHARVKTQLLRKLAASSVPGNNRVNPRRFLFEFADRDDVIVAMSCLILKPRRFGERGVIFGSSVDSVLCNRKYVPYVVVLLPKHNNICAKIIKLRNRRSWPCCREIA